MEIATKATLSKTDKKIIESFAEFITLNTDAVDLRKTLTELYIIYTRLLVISASTGDGTFLRNSSDKQLYHLSELIEILDGGYVE